MVSEATRNSFRYHKFPGGAPPDPLVCVVTVVLQDSLSCIKNLKLLEYSPRPPSPQFDNYCVCRLLMKILDETLEICAY